jgi:hypothetical protein
VRDDPDFIERWALALDDAQVLDPTGRRSTAIRVPCAG